MPSATALTAEDEKALDNARAAAKRMGESIEKYRFREALQEMMNVARIGNKYLADNEPWKKQKTDPDRTAAIMYTAIQLTGILSVIIEPILPFSAQELRNMLGLNGEYAWQTAQQNLLPGGHQIGKAELLFEKIEDEVVEAQLAKLQATKNTQTNPNVMPAKDTITFDDFQKMDIRIGKVLAAEPVPKTDKLLQMTIDTGLDKRTVVSGIAQHYSADEMVGKQVTILVNLAPRKIRGIESQGMILMAEDAEGKLALVSSDDSELMAGSTVA